ncbi:hypothetical protein LGL08_10065 [Clostridium estertheticum]|uniref:hypothetical protein n=1 Tax=Clostridium estertheticum TaxID=238834 RepID=UPI001CF2F358|nr:hypothetical protein [Clostridium estertheticum]MCB2307291.1 hypothetical protein [Clostridium estertheticum]MCB2344941.1 hypothetical protein [Clostridium estertheticum]MCB2349897.1 hypothetical protein [Clostridium estertheticum]WAG48181.1 hypothetical protein LL127_21235 [Clostridium estertheticum]
MERILTRNILYRYDDAQSRVEQYTGTTIDRGFKARGYIIRWGMEMITLSEKQNIIISAHLNGKRQRYILFTNIPFWRDRQKHPHSFVT